MTSSGFISRLALSLALLLSLAGFPVAAQTGGVKQDSVTDSAGEQNMSQIIPVTCTISGRSEGDNARIICAELLSAIQAAHPTKSFVASETPVGPPSVEIRILLATDDNVSLALAVTHANGTEQETENFAVSAMDRSLTPKLRNTLYRHIIAEIPKLD